MVRVFISYRRRDSDLAVPLHDRLGAAFGAENVFRDAESILPGSRFVAEIKGAIARSDVVLALIGQDWKPKTRGRKIDYIALELAEALLQQKPIIPVLLNASPMPEPQDLPLGLQSVAYTHASRLRFDELEKDSASIILGIHERSSQSLTKPSRAWIGTRIGTRLLTPDKLVIRSGTTSFVLTIRPDFVVSLDRTVVARLPGTERQADFAAHLAEGDFVFHVEFRQLPVTNFIRVVSLLINGDPVALPNIDIRSR
jgi:hypothetical protein